MKRPLNEGNTRVPNSVKFSDDRNTCHEFSEMNDNDISPSDSEINIIESLEFYKISLIIAYIICGGANKTLLEWCQ